MITPKIPEFGPIQISVRLGDEPHTEGSFAPHLHIKAYHENVKIINIAPRPDEIIEMQVPHGFYTADMLEFIETSGMKIYSELQKYLDAEQEGLPEPLTYNSTIPFMGEYLPICALADDESVACFRDQAVYLKPGLSSDGICESVLKLFGDMAYGLLKPRLDHFAEIMDVQYSSLGIDDGRRTWGSFNIVTHAIFLSRRLLMISKAGIDSIIVHELAHSKVHIHDEMFLNEILKIIPKYEEVDDAFGEAARRLYAEGWI